VARCTFRSNLASYCPPKRSLVRDLTEIPLPQALHLEELPGPFDDLERPFLPLLAVSTQCFVSMQPGLPCVAFLPGFCVATVTGARSSP
jgi:hypothetical protein